MAEPDNVTPFRPRPKPPPPKRNSGFDPQRPQHKVLLVHALTAATFAIYAFSVPPVTYVGLALGIAAIVIAASNRQEGMPWARTHHEFATRTLVIGAVVSILSGLLGFFPLLGVVGFWAQIAVFVWALARSIAGLLRAFARKPTPNPTTLLL